MFENVFKCFKEKEIVFECMEWFKDCFVDEGFFSAYGARFLRRVIMRLFEDNFFEKMFMGEILEGLLCIMDVNVEGEIMVLIGDGRELKVGSAIGGSVGIA